MSNLKTNYKDDVYTGVRKYHQVNNLDGSISFDDVTAYAQRGDTYGAAQINEHNDILNQLDNSAYRTSDGTTADTLTLADSDTIPYSRSNSLRFKVRWGAIKSFLAKIFSPLQHDSNTNTTYGAGTSSKFGHVKLTDSYQSSAGTANQSVGASSAALYSAYNALNTKIDNNKHESDSGKADESEVQALQREVNTLKTSKADKNHASSSTDYGKGNGSNFGHLKITDNYNNQNATADSGTALSGYGGYQLFTALTPMIAAKAPTNHATSQGSGSGENTPYGKGTNSAFGHVKLIGMDQFSSSARLYDETSGYALSPEVGVYIYESLDGLAKKNHAVSEGSGSGADTPYGRGNNSVYGHVKLTDTINASFDQVSGYAATPKMVAGVYQEMGNIADCLRANGKWAVFTYKNNKYGWEVNGTFYPLG